MKSSTQSGDFIDMGDLVMAIKNRKKRITARISALLLSAAMLCSLSACSDPVAVTKIKGTPTEAGAAESTLLHSVGDKANLQQVGKSGLIELLFDESTYSVCVADLSHDDSEKLWSALPTQENSGAATATLEIVSGDTLYKLNTQDNSVSFQNAQCSFADDALSVTYILTPDTATAHKEKYEKGDIAFKLVVNYQIKDGSVYVSAKYENLVADSDAKLTKLSLLNFFGAYSEPQQGDYIFVPDGSGALIKTDTRDDSFDSELSFPVYGGDAASGHANSGTANALIPAYGMKQGNNAFVTIINSGDAIATVSADRVRGGNDFYEAGVSFDITPCTESKGKFYMSSESYDGDIGLCIRFLGGSNADYTGMAAAAREQLIRERILSTRTAEEQEYLPLDLTVIGVSDDTLFSFKRLNLKKEKTFTDFEQALDMLTRMKSKGINSIKLRYKGALTGGTDQSSIMTASLLARLGTRSDLKDLVEYVNAQNMEMYLDVNLLSAAKGDSFSSGKTAGSIFSKKAEYNAINKSPLGKDKYAKRLLGMKYVERSIIEILRDTRFSQFTGFCLNDVGSLLYSDYKNGFNRQESAEMISEQLPSLTANMKLMTDNGNFRVIKNVSFISHLPTSASQSRSAYVSVPFLQLVLHGIVGYSGEPLNFSENAKTSFLRCVEYGASPAYEWTYSDTYADKKNKSDEDSTDTFGVYYENWIASASESYERADAALKDLQASRMTSHSEIMGGVFCTEYDTGAKIYVNYTESDVTVSGITVPAGDFIRIN